MRVRDNTRGKGLSITQILKKRAAYDIRMGKGCVQPDTVVRGCKWPVREGRRAECHRMYGETGRNGLCDTYVPSSVTCRREEGLQVAHMRDRLYGSWEAGVSQGDMCMSGPTTHGR